MTLEERVSEILRDFTLEEVLEQSNVTPEEALLVLLKHGSIVLPPFLDEFYEEQIDGEDTWMEE